MNKYGLKKVILGLDAGEWLRTRNYRPEENIIFPYWWKDFSRDMDLLQTFLDFYLIFLLVIEVKIGLELRQSWVSKGTLMN